MKRFIRTVKELVIEKKFAILILGGMLGLFSFLVIFLIEDLDIVFADILSFLPEDLLAFLGDLEALANPYGFWALELMTFIWLYAGIYLVFMASSLLSHEVENKTIDLSLSKPISRDKFLGSKIMFLYVFIMTAIGIFFLISLGSMAASSKFREFRAEGIPFVGFLATYFSVVLFLGALAMVAKFISTIFLSTKKSMAFGVMIIFIMFFLGDFYVYMDEAIQDIKYISIFYYFNPVDYLVNADFPLALFIRDIYILGMINVALIVGSLIIFETKDIPN